MIKSIAMPTKNEAIYEAAVRALTGIQQLVKLDREGKPMDDPIITKNTFQKITSERNSPAVLWLSDSEYIIYYPQYSAPCPQKPNEKTMFVHILKGEIYCKNRDMKFVAGDKIKINPLDDYMPYTRNHECYMRVVLGNKNQEIKDVLI